MNITISINEVLRNVLGKFQTVYEKYHEKELENDIVTPNLLDYVDFETQEELFDFLYEEAPMEIFGQAKETEINIISHLVDLYKNLPNGYRLRLVSDDFGRGKAATLWFLAKYGVVVDEIVFYSIKNLDYVWSLTDIFITSDVDIIESKPKDKKLVILNKIYNESFSGDLKIDSLKDVVSFEKLLNNEYEEK
tara:strand:+ start:69 stop:644 length:576 start_codon:yes stop_codon:yes gene_type:complete